MKKTLKFSLITLSLILSWCSFFQNNEKTPAEPRPIREIETINTQATTYNYMNKELWFSLIIPSAWTFQETIFNSIIVLFAPQWSWDTVKENIWLTSIKLTWDTDLNNYYKKTKEMLESIINDFQLIWKKEIQVNNTQAIVIVYEWTEDNQKLKREQVFFLEWNTIYIFTYTALQSTFDTFLQEANSIINSFSI